MNPNNPNLRHDGAVIEKQVFDEEKLNALMDMAKFNPAAKELFLTLVKTAAEVLDAQGARIAELEADREMILKIGVNGQREINTRQYQEKLVLERKLAKAIEQRNFILGTDTVSKNKMDKELEATK